MNRTAWILAGGFAFLGMYGCSPSTGEGGDPSPGGSDAKAVTSEEDVLGVAKLPFPERAVEDDRVVLGAHTDLSGPAAIWGVPGRNGAQMRFDAANAAGGVHGRMIEYVVEDTQYQTPNAIRAANKLLHSDHIFAMVLALGTPQNNAVMPIQFEAGVPNVFPFSGSRSMNEPFHKLSFTQRGVYYDEIRAAVQHFHETKGRTRPCPIYQDTDYGHEILEAVIDQAAELGLEIPASSAHKKTESEFTAAVLKLKNADCDLVLFGTIYHDTLLILDTAKRMGWTDVDFVGNDAAYGQAIANAESGAAEGYHVFTHLNRIYADSDISPEVGAWYDEYVEKFGSEPNAGAMEAWRAADLTVLALERAGRNLTRDRFVAALESITDYTDMWGNRVSFGPDDHKGVTDSNLAQVQDRRWVLVGKSIRFD